MPGSDEFHGYRSHQPVDRKADTRTWASPHNRMYFPAVLMWRRKIARIQASTRIEQGSQRLLLRRRPENAKGVSRLKGPSASGLGPPYGNNEQDGGFSISDAEYLVTNSPPYWDQQPLAARLSFTYCHVAYAQRKYFWVLELGGQGGISKFTTPLPVDNPSDHFPEDAAVVMIATCRRATATTTGYGIRDTEFL
ncbi:hypothetical protein CISG_05677 [Coccidioides immitis RMSCC 3703]|uniref:Uncharacterized protein n=1 Tax=Coccidioides immitis RMSCC 3703 TaxID=454286 RepID=A0A0J8QVG2_COCIT|nr:hypothetical protein CISG_05677 [Coccidioides immitis RMSCC 3703]